MPFGQKPPEPITPRSGNVNPAHCLKQTLKRREQNLLYTKKDYIRDTIEPKLHDLAVEFWHNERKFRVEEDEWLHHLIDWVKSTHNIDLSKSDDYDTVALNDFLEKTRNYKGEPLFKKKEEETLDELRKDCEILADKLMKVKIMEEEIEAKKQTEFEAAKIAEVEAKKQAEYDAAKASLESN